MIPPLFHYTCDHAAARITDTIHPAAHLMPPEVLRSLPPEARLISQLVWMTDVAAVTGLNRHLLGLTNRLDPDCDRSRFRYRVAPGLSPAHWSRVRARWLHPALNSPLYRRVVQELEAAAGVDPDRWWVWAGPVPVALDMHRRNHRGPLGPWVLA
jgi:hypothetical protein